MLYVCVSGMMDVVFSVCIVTRGAVCARGNYDSSSRCCVLCAPCDSLMTAL